MMQCLTTVPQGRSVTVELDNSSTADTRQPHGPQGGFFVPVFRGRRPCPGLRPKKRRPVRWRVINPRGAIGLITRVAPAIAANGATDMTLPKTVQFQDTDLSVIDRDGTPWLTSKQIAYALGCKNPAQDISNIHQRHRDEFTEAMTTVIRHGRSRVRIFSPRGAHLIAMFARTPRAKAFRQWVLDVLEAHTSQPPALPAPLPFQEQRRYLVVMEGGKVAGMTELGDECMVPRGRVEIVRRNLATVREQLAALIGEASVSALDVELEAL